MKRKTALEIIKKEYVQNGKSTMISVRAYVESKISIEARNKAITQGMAIFENRN